MVEQTVAHFWRGVTPLPLAMTTFTLTLPLAVVSWNLVEKPALDRRHELGRLAGELVQKVLSR